MTIQTNIRAGAIGVGRCGGIRIPPVKAPGTKAA